MNMEEKIPTNITLRELLARWKGHATLEIVDKLVRDGILTAYDKQNVHNLQYGCYETVRGNKRPNEFGINGSDNSKGKDDIFFDIYEIQKLDKQIVMSKDERTIDYSTVNKQKLDEEEKQIASLKKENDELKKQKSTVNAGRWENSVRAALELFVEIMQNDKKEYIEEDFKEALKEKYQGYNTTVLKLAWKLLPQQRKHGSGRPKKGKNTEHIDNS